MKVYLGAVCETEQVDILESHAVYSKSHQIVTDPSAADVILILGAPPFEPQRLLDYELYKAFPERCAIYSEDDDCLPIIPGVHANAPISQHTRIGRIFNYAHITRNGAVSKSLPGRDHIARSHRNEGGKALPLHVSGRIDLHLAEAYL